MNVYQIIKCEYDSDDGHYTFEPFESLVHLNEADALKIRNDLNSIMIMDHNEQIAALLAEAIERGWETKKSPHYRYYQTFDGDPTDIDAIERFANRENALTYFTITKLPVVQ